MVEPLLDAVGGRERYRVFDVATGSEWTPRPPRAGACMPGLGFSADQLRRPQAGLSGGVLTPLGHGIRYALPLLIPVLCLTDEQPPQAAGSRCSRGAR